MRSPLYLNFIMWSLGLSQKQTISTRINDTFHSTDNSLVECVCFHARAHTCVLVGWQDAEWQPRAQRER